MLQAIIKKQYQQPKPLVSTLFEGKKKKKKPSIESWKPKEMDSIDKKTIVSFE
jgi:hypothetical protein